MRKTSMALTDPDQPDPSLPPPPIPPAEEECCGRGCDPCVHDYYEAALEKWRQQVKSRVKSVQPDLPN